MRLIISLTLVALVSGLASAQIVFDDPKPKKVEAKAKPAAPARQERPAGKRSMESWIKTLASGLGDGNAAIRRSAAVALSNVGAPAVPVLEKMAAGEGPSSKEARRVLDQIKRRGRRGATGAGSRRGADRPNAQKRLTSALKKAGFDESQMGTVAKHQKVRQERMREIFRQVQDGELTREEAGAARQKAQRELNAALKGELGNEAFRKFSRASRAANGRNSDRPGDRRRRDGKRGKKQGEGNGGE